MKYIKIDKDFDDTRIDKYLRKLFPNTSLSIIYKFIRKGLIKVNNKRVGHSYRLALNDIVSWPDWLYSFSEINKEKLFRQRLVKNSDYKRDFHFKVLYEDENLCIISKPKNITVHQGNDKNKPSISSLLKIPGCLYSPSPVHRLDYDTTGCLLIARDRNTAKILSLYFKENKIDKYYLAKVRGRITEEKEIAYSLSNKCAITRIKPFYTKDDYSVLFIKLITGRKHQIKYHLNKIGHPVLELHCFSLGFIHPETKKYLYMVDKNIDWLDKKLVNAMVVAEKKMRRKRDVLCESVS
ncbi:MAG: RluA family pseudouridine synthase [Candidatus Hydrogenedentota bacterium]